MPKILDMEKSNRYNALMKTIKKIVFFLIFTFTFTSTFTSTVFAVEVAPRISDREIVEKLSALDAKIDRVNAKIDIEIANVLADIKELKAGQAAFHPTRTCFNF